MKRTGKYLMLSILAAIILASCSNEYPVHYELDLSEQQWSLWPDTLASWKEDPLFLPPVSLGELESHSPGCGWSKLYSNNKLHVKLPATTEEYYQELFPLKKGFDYIGVSWFTTEVKIPKALEGKRIILSFESVRIRAEVYVNEKLSGYDCIGNTPFEVDITEAVTYGKKNKLAIRITDPGGNFGWEDYHLDYWGSTPIPPSHGFGGITGKIILKATEKTYIEDVFIENKAEISSIGVHVELKGVKELPIGGRIDCTITEIISNSVVHRQSAEVVAWTDQCKISSTLTVDSIQNWSPEQPHLYELKVSYNEEERVIDQVKDRFGFRWFETRDIDGDKQFFLNGEQIFLLSAISWGYWPANGIFPRDELAEKQILTARKLGLNMLNFHRAIGQEAIFDKADELGLLLYEEPGGYRCPSDNIIFWDLESVQNSIDKGSLETAWKMRREKLVRMIKRDRNHPSLIIYNMANEILSDPDSVNIEDIRMAHELDPSRFITFSSQTYEHEYFPAYDYTCPDVPAPSKLYMEPGNAELLYQGWWDDHNALGPGCLIDTMHYKDPKHYYLYTDHQSEIRFYGEEGGTGIPSKYSGLEKAFSGLKYKGWDGSYYINAANEIRQELERSGMDSAFPHPDSLAASFGKLAYSYHARMIENCRMNGYTDAYVINGWENSNVGFNSGIVDVFRNPKGDPAILRHYAIDEYIAVKARSYVQKAGKVLVLDLFNVGSDLPLSPGLITIRFTIGDELIEELRIPADLTKKPGIKNLIIDHIKVNTPVQEASYYIDISVKVEVDGQLIKQGKDRVFMVCPHMDPKITELDVWEEGNRIKTFFMESTPTLQVHRYSEGIPKSGILLLGETIEKQYTEELLQWVKDGNMLILLTDAHLWAEQLNEAGLIKYRGLIGADQQWMGGGYFVKEHPIFDNLPVDQAFNWEYQVFQRLTNNRHGLEIENVETIVGLLYQESKISSSLAVKQLGKGKIIFNTLPIIEQLDSKEEAAVIGDAILLNLISYSKQ